MSRPLRERGRFRRCDRPRPRIPPTHPRADGWDFSGAGARAVRDELDAREQIARVEETFSEERLDAALLEYDFAEAVQSLDTTSAAGSPNGTGFLPAQNAANQIA